MAFNEKWDRYKITKITDLDGNDRTDKRYSGNIGRLCLPNGHGEGHQFFATFMDPKGDDRFLLGIARNISKTKSGMIITTDNSIWHFKCVDKGGKAESAAEEERACEMETPPEEITSSESTESEGENGTVE